MPYHIVFILEHQGRYKACIAISRNMAFKVNSYYYTDNALDEKYDTAVFTDPTIKGQLDKNAVKTKNIFTIMSYMILQMRRILQWN